MNDFFNYLSVFGFAVLLVAIAWGLWSLIKYGFKRLVESSQAAKSPAFKDQINSLIDAHHGSVQHQLNGLRADLMALSKKMDYLEVRMGVLDASLASHVETKKAHRK